MVEAELGLEKFDEERVEPMTDEELGNLLAAVGNSESKAVLMGIMGLSPHTIFTGNTMRQRLAEVQRIPARGRSSFGWVPLSDTTVEGYCKNSFEPIGLVALELRDEMNSYGYQATDKGQNDGLAIAGSVLKVSEEYNLPLRKLFSNTSSHSREEEIENLNETILFKQRAPLNRVRIYRALAQLSGPVRVVDLAHASGVSDSIVIGHCRELRDLGMLQYESVENEGAKTDYVIKDVPEQLPLEPSLKGLTRQVVDLMMSDKSRDWKVDSIAAGLIEKYPEKRDQTTLIESIRDVLKFLRRREIVVTPHFSNEKSSDVYLTDEQKVVISELVDLLKRIQHRDSDTMAEGKNQVNIFLQNPDLVRRAMQRGREASSHANIVPAEDVNKSIETALFEHPGATVDTLRQYLKETYGYNLAHSTIRRYLKNLRDAGEIESEGVVGGVMHWRMKKQVS